MGPKIVVAGHIGVDITPVFPAAKRGSLSEILCPGKLIHMNEAVVCTGGAVCNTGLALKKIGADVRLVAKVGKDAFGDLLLEMLSRYDASGDIIVDESVSTAYTVVIAPPGIDRIFLHGPGANDSFCAEDLPDEVLVDAALIHYGYPPLMRRMYEAEGAELLKLCRRIHESGAAVSLDLAAVDPDSEAGKADWRAILTRVLPEVDFFVPSVEELCAMLDPHRYADWSARATGRDMTEILDIERDIRPLADEAMALGVKVLMLKCGAQGIYYRTAGRDLLRQIPERARLSVSDWADREGFQRSFVPECVRSGTGAGDTSISAFLYAMLKGFEPEHCVKLAAAEGASCVEAFDALSGIRTLEELEEKIRAGWKTGDEGAGFSEV
ncbi:MAG: carbohydrate kinase family protein [Clostridiales bacterium]|nr:carbohydrate kinase family protein [Clostridiales bacterium]